MRQTASHIARVLVLLVSVFASRAAAQATPAARPPLALVYTRCSDRTPLVEGAEVTALVRIELGDANVVVLNDIAVEHAPGSVLQLHVCGASARVTRVWPSGFSDEREIDLADLAAEARVRVSALVLAEIGRTDAEDPGRPAAAPTEPVKPWDPETELPPGALRGRPSAPSRLAQDLTFVARSFATPWSLAFGPRIALAFARWEIGLESATASTTQNATQIVVGLATASLGYTIFSVGQEARFYLTPTVELGPTWFRTSASADSESARADSDDANTGSEASTPSLHKRTVWAAGTLRAGLNVALTPPIYARFSAFGGYAHGVRARAGNVTQLTTRGGFGGIAIGVGWEH